MPALARKISQAWSGASPAGDVAEIRRQIGALKSERDTIENAPRPEAEAVELIDQLLTRWAGSQPSWVGPDVLAAACAAGYLPEVELSGNTSLGQTLSLLSPMLRPIMRTALIDALHQHYDSHEPGLPDGERVAKLKAIDAQILRLERTEEDAIMAARAAGFMIERRADADPIAILGLD